MPCIDSGAQSAKGRQTAADSSPLNEMAGIMLVSRFLRFSTKVTEMKDTGKAVAVTFETADGKTETREFDRVLVSIGRTPNSEGLGLENTKVKVIERGFVEVNDKQQTADPDIYAIGDIAGEPMLAHKAAHEAKVAVDVIAGEPAAFFMPRPEDPQLVWAQVLRPVSR